MSYDKRQWLDDYFRAQLKEYRSTPPSKVWDNIQSQLRRDKKFGYTLGGRLLAGLLAAILIGLWWFDTSEGELSTATQSVDLSQENTTTIDDRNSLNSTVVRTEGNPQPLPAQIAETPQAPTKEHQPNSVNKETKLKVYSQSPLFPSSKRASQFASSTTHTDETPTYSSTHTPLIDASAPHATVVGSTAKAMTSGYSSSERSISDIIHLLPPYRYRPVQSITAPVQAPLPIGGSDCMKLVYRPYQHRSIEIGVGPFISDRLLYTLDSSWQGLIFKRNEAESQRRSWNASILYRWSVARDVYIKSGIQFHMLREQFRYQNGIDVKYIINSNGDTIKRIEKPHYDIFTNRYTFWDIPLYISYTWGIHRIFVDLNSGITFNFYSQQRGYLYDYEGKARPMHALLEGGKAPFRRFAGLSLSLSLNLGYQFHSQFGAFVEPGVQYFLRPLSTEAYPIKQKYVFYRFNLGVRYTLFE